MVKADDKVKYEGNKAEKYTHFEELQVKVRQLIEIVDLQASILRENGLVRKEVIEAPYFNEDEVYQELED